MKINLTCNIETDLALRPLPVRMYSGSALPLELYGIPDSWCGGQVTAVSVAVTNADGQPLTAACTKVGDGWMALFAAGGFSRYGTVIKGVKVVVSIVRPDETVAQVILAVSDLVIDAASATAEPGGDTGQFVIKGDDVYLKTTVIDGVQHFVRQEMVQNGKYGWAAEWTGDYILSGGNYIPANAGETDGGEA